jgi:SAM-dependent methyltransferase
MIIMANPDSFNLTMARSKEETDQINKKFYGRYNYPWPPSAIPAYPAGIAKLMLEQDIGCWDHRRIPARPKIWVAGCGANQALFTALKFPEAEVLGTDISSTSLAACKKNAEQIGINNLKLEEKSLNEVAVKDEYDYIICTGVVHHNAKPRETLSKIAGALKRNGVLELMVYNYYHRLQTTACQKAVRTFYDAGAGLDMDIELSLSAMLIRDFPYQNLMGEFIRSFADAPEAAMADSLLQPVEYSYTIESLASLAGECNLECLLHCLNQFDVTEQQINWNMKFGNSSIQDIYDQLPDIKRWQIANLLLFNESPMLWFYFQRKDADRVRKTEGQICDEFLDMGFRRNVYLLRNYELGPEGEYNMRNRAIRVPNSDLHADATAKKILHLADPDRKMKDIFRHLNISATFHTVNEMRIKLTTSAFPYLLS